MRDRRDTRPSSDPIPVKSRQNAARSFEHGDCFAGVAALRTLDIQLKHLRGDPTLIAAARRGVATALHHDDLRGAERLVTLFPELVDVLPSPQLSGAALLSPRRELPGGTTAAAERLFEDVARIIAVPATAPNVHGRGGRPFARSFHHPDLRIRHAVEIFCDTDNCARVRESGARLPYVSGVHRVMPTVFSIRTQVVVEPDCSLTAALATLTDRLRSTIFHELCHVEQELYRSAHPRKKFPESAPPKRETTGLFGELYHYLLEIPDERGAFLAEAAFVATLTGQSLEDALTAVLDDTIPGPGPFSPLSPLEHSILMTTTTETLRRGAGGNSQLARRRRR